MIKQEQRTHNEWFRTVSLGGRKSCPNCGCKLLGGSVWSWGEYVNAKWRTVKHFCRECYPTEVHGPLVKHTGECGCAVTLVGRGERLPTWLSL
jgi:hypothetical protein